MRIEPEWLDYSISRMEETFTDSTVEDLVYQMKEIGCGHNSCGVEILGGTWYTLTELLHKPIKRAPARHIICKFYGGPPGNQAVFQGTLLTMLMDRLLMQSATAKPPQLLDVTRNEAN